MNRRFFLAFILLVGMMAGFTACSENTEDDVEYKDWQQVNAKYFNDIFAKALLNEDGRWDTIRCWSLNDTVAKLNPTSYIVVHKEEDGAGSGCPMYTDSVMVHNFGKLLPSLTYTNGYVIEKSWDGIGGLKLSDDPAQNYEMDFQKYNPATAVAKKWAVGGLIDGYTTALMRMHIGDRWRVYVPWTLGYGTTEYNSIPGYSVLVWDIKLLGYYHPGADIPSTNAKKHDAALWITE